MKAPRSRSLGSIFCVGSVCAWALVACSKTAPEVVSNTNSAAEVASTAKAAEPPSAPPPPASAPPVASSAPSAAPAPSGPMASTLHPALLDPSKAQAKAPETFKAKFTTTKGSFVIEVHRDWAPNGADRFYNLVKMGFFDDTRFFRAVDGFMVQFGLSGDPAVNAKWQEAGIHDDPVKQSNTRGFVTFAQRNTPDTRTTQIFINYADNARLDGMRFAPFGKVTQGMEVVDGLYKGYGEGAPSGAGPDQGRIQSQGNAYLDTGFPRLDGVKTAQIVP